MFNPNKTFYDIIKEYKKGTKFYIPNINKHVELCYIMDNENYNYPIVVKDFTIEGTKYQLNKHGTKLVTYETNTKDCLGNYIIQLYPYNFTKDWFDIFTIPVNSIVVFKEKVENKVFKLGKYIYGTTIIYGDNNLVECEVIIPFNFFDINDVK